MGRGATGCAVSKLIADVEHSIESQLIAIQMQRDAKPKKGDKLKLDKMLVELARLEAERLRFMEHQLTFNRYSN